MITTILHCTLGFHLFLPPLQKPLVHIHAIEAKYFHWKLFPFEFPCEKVKSKGKKKRKRKPNLSQELRIPCDTKDERLRHVDGPCLRHVEVISWIPDPTVEGHAFDLGEWVDRVVDNVHVKVSLQCPADLDAVQWSTQWKGVGDRGGTVVVGGG